MPIVSFVINGTHGTARLESACRAAAERAGCKSDIFVTESGDAGIAAASQAVTAGAELVVAVGGDGTVRSCAQALAGGDVPLGIVPLGTANLLARTLNLPSHVHAALRVALTGRDRLIDIAAADGTPFTAMAGIGLDAAVVAATRFKHRLGWGAYAFSGVAHLAAKPATFTITIDDREPVTRSARSVIIANCGLLPGGFTILKDARPDDGALDVGVLAPHGPLGWIALAGHVIRGDGHLERYKARTVEIRMTAPLPRQADGEVLAPSSTLTVTVRPRSLLVRSVLGCGSRPECDAIPGIRGQRTESRWGQVAADAQESLLGKVGRVTVSIPAKGPGEVLLPVRGGSEAFAAWSDEPIPRHRRVVVVECISARSVFVTPVL